LLFLQYRCRPVSIDRSITFDAMLERFLLSSSPCTREALKVVRFAATVMYAVIHDFARVWYDRLNLDIYSKRHQPNIPDAMAALRLEMKRLAAQVGLTLPLTKARGGLLSQPGKNRGSRKASSINTVSNRSLHSGCQH
jgi:hypothetical protein